ncbi:MAG: hypothetical protein ACTHOD_19005 [Motilibacteraceae bacterium]
MSTSPPRSLLERTRPLRWAGAVLLVLLGTAAVALGWVRVCTSGACRPPQAGDVVVLGWLALVVLLLAPDLSEASVAGLLTLKTRLGAQQDTIDALSARLAAVQTQLQAQLQAQLATSTAVGGGAVVTVVSGTATAAWARADLDGLPPDVVHASRYLAGELLMAHLGDLGSGVLESTNLRLYLPGEDGLLLPVLDPPRQHYDDDVWRPGQGAVGRAWSSAALVAVTGGQVQADVADLPERRRARYAALRQVVAVPVLARDGTAVGVLSASSRDLEPDLRCADVEDELVAAAEVAARVLVDLLGWATDAPSALAMSPRPTGEVTSSPAVSRAMNGANPISRRTP